MIPFADAAAFAFRHPIKNVFLVRSSLCFEIEIHPLCSHHSTIRKTFTIPNKRKCVNEF
jgi:hypothetical protein